MKKVTPIPNFDILKENIQNKISNKIDLKVDEAFEKIPTSLKKWLNPKLQIWMKILSIFTFFISLFIMINFLKKINQYIIDNLEEEKIYKESLKEVKEIQLENIEKTKDKKELFKNRVPSIPRDAVIIDYTNIWNLKINEKYDACIQMGTARWTRSSGDRETTFLRNTGYVKLQTKKLLPDFEFTLSKDHLLFAKKIKLENKEFNKKFSLISNDEVQIRMVYTPLSMEETLKYDKEIKKTKYWSLSKKQDELKIIFLPKDIKTLNINISTNSSKSKEIMKQNLKKDISEDIIDLYKVILLALIPPLL